MITSLGAGSGLDLESLVSQLIAAEGQPTTLRLAQRESEYQARLSGLGLLSSALADFRGSLSGLQKPGDFQGRSINLSHEELVTATASPEAAAGTYQLELVQLAKPHKLISPGFADETTTLGSGALTILAGETALSVTIDSGNNSLAGIRDAINQAAAGSGVNATIITVDDGSGGTQSKLLLTAGKPGTDNKIDIVVSDSDGNDTDPSGLSVLAFQSGGVQNMAEAQAASNAQIRIDGQTLTSSSNTISNAVSGVTLNLLKAEAGSEITLTVQRDTASVSARVTDFVKGYNNLWAAIQDLSRYDEQAETAGVLLGDATLRGVERQLRALVFGDNSASQALPNLSAMGITSRSDGTLEIDQEKLNSAVQQHFSAFSDFFAGADGLATKLSALADDFGGTSGAIADRNASIAISLDRIEDQRSQLNRRLAGLEERLRAQFSALDVLVASLNSSSAFLSDQLQALPGFVRDAN